jgi:hypothetical protein
MKTRISLLINLGVLCLAGLFAWFAFQKDAGPAVEGELILDVAADALSHLSYTTENRTITADLLPSGDGFQMLVSEVLSTRKAKKVKKEADKKEADKKETRVTRYRASPEFKKALERLLPLRALRSIESVDEQALETFGLTEPTGRLTFRARDQSVTYLVGKKTYGRASVYIRSDKGGPVHLVSAGLVTTVDFRPPRYKELRYLGLTSKQVERVVLTCPGLGSRTFVHRSRLEPGGGFWATEETPEQENSLVGNWMGKLFRLSLVEYLAEPVAPNPGSLCRMVFLLEDQKQATAELTWSEGESGRRLVHGRSDFSGDWVKLEPGSAGSLIGDLPGLVGEEAPAGSK